MMLSATDKVWRKVELYKNHIFWHFVLFDKKL